MSGGKDWLPGRRADQLALAKKWAPVVNVNKTAWGITQDELTRLGNALTQVDTWSVTFAQSGKPGDNARLRAAYTELRAIMRIYKTRRFLMPPLKYDDFFDLGLEPPDLVRTPHIEVTERVALRLELRATREIVVHFWVDGSPNRAKPEGYEGAVVIWAVLDTPPATQDELTSHTMASRTPLVIPFDETDRGRTVYISACWQNERGNTGAWCDIVPAIIP